jgi:two-component system, chemotaxis family, CheB/CheR fusion protein
MSNKEEFDPHFEALLEHLKRNRGFDFTGYKRSSLVRRVRTRMHTVGITDYPDYIDYLEVHPEEFALLFNTILINVTTFFRDPEAWQYLAENIIPTIINKSANENQIRIWSAGCASGQEAYTLAMLFCEALGWQEFHDRVKIYATDVDEEALSQARMGTYSSNETKDVPLVLADKYFTVVGKEHVFRSDMRRSIIFGRHDLMKDAPIPQLHLLTCRNTLMYFNAEAQSAILRRFHFALRPNGYLFLGKAEMLLSHGNLFNQVGLEYRVFSKVNKLPLGDRLISLTQPAIDSIHNDRYTKLHGSAFDVSIAPQLIVETGGEIALVNEAARHMFGLTTSDIGRPMRDLEISYRPVELRSLIDQAMKERRSIRSGKVTRNLPDGAQQLEVIVTPLTNNGDAPLGTSIAFHDVTKFQKLYTDLQCAHEELETINEELQATNEELETTNEELQSTNEELETTNEELHSTNEELETTNEELQSTNEELEATNTQLNSLTVEVNDINVFLGAVMSSIKYGVIVLDQRLHVQMWTARSEELWGLRSDEVAGKDIGSLDIGLPVDNLKKTIRTFASGKDEYAEFKIDAHNRKGKAISCGIRLTRLHPGIEESEGFVVLIDEL